MNTLKAEKRSMDVKAKRLRREGYVTGNVFGREIEGSIPVKMLKTEGKISRSLLLFALPMMAGNLLQQFYNIADTLIVGRVLGSNALAAVGSAYTLMTFLTSIFLGLSMGSGLFFLFIREKTIRILCAVRSYMLLH